MQDIQDLVTNQVREGKNLEYKRVLAATTGDEKKEFLADISSFANTSGGDLLFGVTATDGIATSITPIEISNIDSETLRLESIIRTGLDPRIAAIVHAIPADIANNYVLIIRIEESWNKPHRIVFSGSGKFFARSSAGKYELDVEELRQAFTLSDGIEKKINDFRADRLISIETGNVHLPLSSKHVIAVHVMPLESFSTKLSLTKEQLLSFTYENDSTNLFQPMYWGNSYNSPNINLEGMYAYSPNPTDGGARSYVQLFRNGSIEIVESLMLDRQGSDQIPYGLYEKEIIRATERALKILAKLNINMPVYIGVSLLNVKGLIMARGGRREADYEHTIRQKDLILPLTLMDDSQADVAETLRTTFDLVWNACGIPNSLNYDADGNWIAH